MSLRGKIILLFLGLAIVPLLVLAAFGYWQAIGLAEDVVGGSLDDAAQTVATSLEEGADRLELQLEELAEGRATQDLLAGRSTSEMWEARMRTSMAPFAFLELHASETGSSARVGTDNALRCTPRGGSRLARFRRAISVGGHEAHLEAGVWLDDLIVPFEPQGSGSILVFDRSDGTMMLSTQCGDFRGARPMTLAAATDGHPAKNDKPERFSYEAGGGEQLAAFQVVGNRPWSVVSSAPVGNILEPLSRIQVTYWLFVMMVTVATAMAFSILLGRVVRSLEELTRATDRIGDGELDPWLPPPGGDEVGRLSLAFSGMLDRVRQTMRRVDQSGRLAVVGQLAAYLAHEIRTPLSSLRMNLQSLQRDLRRGRIPEECGEAIEISLREVDRLAGSVTGVLQLGRPPAGEREIVGIHDVIQEAAELLAGEFRRSGIQLHLELDAAADRVLGAAGPIKGVFLNLLMNGLEAQPEGGRLDVRSRLGTAKGAGPVVAVHVRDGGLGIPPEIRERIFEPFFSTKPQGSGIGLAVASRTIRENGGDLYLAELPEAVGGTVFVVELPLAPIAAESLPEPDVKLPPWMQAPQESVSGPEPGPAVVVAMGRTTRSNPETSIDVARMDGAPAPTLVATARPDHGEVG